MYLQPRSNAVLKLFNLVQNS